MARYDSQFEKRQKNIDHHLDQTHEKMMKEISSKRKELITNLVKKQEDEKNKQFSFMGTQLQGMNSSVVNRMYTSNTAG